MPFEIDDKIEV